MTGFIFICFRAVNKETWSRTGTHVLPEEEGQDGSCQLRQEDEEDQHEELTPEKSFSECTSEQT